MIKNSAAALAARFQRIPKFALFGAVALLQLAALSLMIADRIHVLLGGTEVTLLIRPVDPRDLLRGDYVVLSYDISRLPAGPLENQPVRERNPVVFVKLTPNRDGIYEAVSVHTDPVPVKSPEVLIRGHVDDLCGSAFCDKLWISYNIERYFVPEGEGRKLEQLRNSSKLTVVASVLPSGRAAIKRLLVDGQPAYEEPWF